jgi:MFS family permease
LWGALLGISLQARTVELNPEHYVVAYGQLAAAGAMTASLMQLVMGPISDRLRASGTDRRLFFIAGALLGSIGICGFYFAHSFAMLVGSLVFLQLAVNTAIGPYQAIIPDYLPPARAGLASAWMAGLQSLGNAAGALCAVTLSKNPVALSAVLAAMLLSTCAITVAHVRGLRLRQTEHAAFHVERAAVDLFISRAILWVGFYTVLGYMFFYVQDTLHVRDAVVTSGIVTLLFTVFGVAGAICRCNRSSAAGYP